MKVTAYQSMQVLFAEDDEKLQELRNAMFVAKDPKMIALAKHPVFPERADYFPSGFFRVNGERKTWDIADPATYAECKKLLAEKIAERPLTEIFEEPHPGPFFELLYYMEGDGPTYMIGPKTSEKLARDFADHKTRAESIGGKFYEVFMKWKSAFDFAAKTGAVRFHP